MRCVASDRRCERGQSLVELALVLPFMLLILFGIVDLGRVFNAYIVITNASREGALYGSFHPPKDAVAVELIKDRVLTEASGSGVALDRSLIQVAAAGTAAGSPVTVTVAYPFSAVSTIMESFFSGSTLMLQANTVMVIRE